MKKLNFYLSDQQYAKLMQLQEQSGLSMAEWIRRGIDALPDHAAMPTFEDIKAMPLPTLQRLVARLSDRFEALANDPMGGQA